MHCLTIQHLARLSAIRSWQSLQQIWWFQKYSGFFFHFWKQNLLIQRSITGVTVTINGQKGLKTVFWCFWGNTFPSNIKFCGIENIASGDFFHILYGFTGDKVLKYCLCIILLLYIPLEKVAIIQFNNLSPLYTSMIIKLVKFLNVLCREQNVKIFQFLITDSVLSSPW